MVPREQVAEVVEANAREWVALAGEHGDRFGLRPSDDRWSGLENVSRLGPGPRG
ncbi:MAG TPA: hypothetical protein VK611_22005 [Acidimicrobiales bacterium]|nr:hypothetical protein [Acidimicrobiales bacterium]